MGEKMHKITMTNFQMETLQDAFEHFITRCRVKNLSEESETAAYFHLTEKYVEEIERGALKTLRDVMNDG